MNEKSKKNVLIVLTILYCLKNIRYKSFFLNQFK